MRLPDRPRADASELAGDRSPGDGRDLGERLARLPRGHPSARLPGEDWREPGEDWEPGGRGPGENWEPGGPDPEGAEPDGDMDGGASYGVAAPGRRPVRDGGSAAGDLPGRGEPYRPWFSGDGAADPWFAGP